jgi:hypothetical protein
MAEEPKIRSRASRAPWFAVTRALPLSFDVRKIALGTVALIAIQAVWAALLEIAPGSAAFSEPGGLGAPVVLGNSLGSMIQSALWGAAEPHLELIGPMVGLFSIDRGVVGSGIALIALLWATVVMGIIGGAVARSAVREVATGDRGTLIGNLRFALRSARPLLIVPLFPLAVAAVCGGGFILIGLLYRLPLVGSPLAAVTLFVPLVLGLVMAALLVDLAAGWPLIHVSVAADAASELDALTRAFGYVNRRPVQFVMCVAAVWLAGAAGLVAVDFFSRAILHLAVWGLSFTAPPVIVAGLGGPRPDAATMDSIAGSAAFFWARVAQVLARGWVYGYYWSAASMIYLVLRSDVDGAPFTEIKNDDDAML